MAQTWSRCPRYPEGMGLGDPTAQMGIEGRNNTCGEIEEQQGSLESKRELRHSKTSPAGEGMAAPP